MIENGTLSLIQMYTIGWIFLDKSRSDKPVAWNLIEIFKHTDGKIDIIGSIPENFGAQAQHLQRLQRIICLCETQMSANKLKVNIVLSLQLENETKE